MSIDRSTDTVLKNISELNRRSEIISEQRRLSILQLAQRIFDSAPIRRAEEIYGEFLRKTDGVCQVDDKLDFCREICNRLNLRKIGDLSPFSELESAVPPGSHEKIAMIRNSYNDRAYAKFSAAIPHSKAVYYTSFEDCCEAVASGSCEFILLPIEDNADGKMFGFYSLLDRFELRICEVCGIESNSKTIRYALAGRNFRLGEIEKNHSVKERFLEFSLTYNTDCATPDLFTAAALCHAELYRTASLSLPYNDMMTRFYFSFKITKNTDLVAFLTFLWLEYPQYTPIGIYRYL